MRQEGTKESALWGKGDSRVGRAIAVITVGVVGGSFGGFFSLSSLGWFANWVL